MLTPTSIDWPGEPCILPTGTTLMRRAEHAEHVIHIDRGRVALGITDSGALAHQLGMIEGPCWLNATCAVLNLPPLVDAIADSEVKLRRVVLADFQAGLGALPAAARTVLRDVARAHRQQSELAVSRLAKDAEARCAEWLLRHAEPMQDAPSGLAVMLRQRKRMIAAQLGIAPETLSRVLRHLRERSLISGSGRVLNLLDLNGLRALAGA
ncbi:MAG: Crp/Fnr family transcriptional regulator [Pseudomonadota bacterium]|nr:Crp/Fnr family transcriptional regulator [Pseudomonadota bacterium]